MRKKVRAKTTKKSTISNFEDYQSMVVKTDERKQRLVSLLGLVGEVGDLHSRIKKLLLQKDDPTFRAELREEFGDILWYLTSLASLHGLPLQEIAEENAKKAELLYLDGNRSNFDQTSPDDEKLPRRFTVNFYEKPLEPGVYVKISINGIVIGDALTDNSHEDDGYRYHDVFHLAYAAVLGWSPVTRALLKCKRKSVKKLDEVEDGARALIIEEAISIILFNHGPSRGWYSEKTSIDIRLLKIIQQMVDGLEVRACTAKQWKNAIHQGYTAFNQLMKNGGGDILVDLDQQEIKYVLASKKRKTR